MVCFGKKNPIQKEKTCELLRRNKIAYLFQNFALVEKMSVWENMSLAAKYGKYKDHGARIRKTLGYMGVADKLKSKVYELSGGEQQRVAIARNMVKPFDIMLADEPTGSLDAENKAIVMNALMELHKAGKTIVVVSHDMDFRRIAGISYGIENACLQELN